LQTGTLIARGPAKNRAQFHEGLGHPAIMVNLIIQKFVRMQPRFQWPRLSRLPLMGAVTAVIFNHRARRSKKCSHVSCLNRPLALPELNFLNHIAIKPYGVLGDGQNLHGKMFNANAPPDGSVAVVDPAGLQFIQPPGGPKGAGGAAGACYRWLGIHQDVAFPAEVVAAVRNTGDAKYHVYAADKKVIHAVGPDLRRQSYSEDEAIHELSNVYKNIFYEFIMSEVATLRLLPVSGGIFAGNHKRRIPTLTFAALDEAFLKLSNDQKDTLMNRDVHLCIFMEKVVEEFMDALQGLTNSAEDNGATEVV